MMLYAVYSTSTMYAVNISYRSECYESAADALKCAEVCP